MESGKSCTSIFVLSGSGGGATGPTGPTGEIGPTGPIGEIGPTGPAGESVPTTYLSAMNETSIEVGDTPYLRITNWSESYDSDGVIFDPNLGIFAVEESGMYMINSMVPVYQSPPTGIDIRATVPRISIVSIESVSAPATDLVSGTLLSALMSGDHISFGVYEHSYTTNVISGLVRLTSGTIYALAYQRTQIVGTNAQIGPAVAEVPPMHLGIHRVG